MRLVYNLVDEPGVMQRQMPIQTLQKTVEALQILYVDRVVNMLVVVQRQVSMVEMVIMSDSFVTAPCVLTTSSCSSSEVVFCFPAS